ncbi:MAG TPA: hypothetical protein VM865_08680 [Acidobacteriaceae bacterium]|jgi:hypothetical protein|nr:hypothetical protein [Acidobacteriaceae bacterium]
MVAIMLLGILVVAGVALALVAYSSNQRKRAGQSGEDAVRDQQVKTPRADPPNV